MRKLATLINRPLGMSRRQFATQLAIAAFFGLMFVLTGSTANAQTPEPASYSVESFAGSAETKIYENLGFIMPVFIAVALTMLGIGMAKKWLFRGAKQS